MNDAGDILALLILGLCVAAYFARAAFNDRKKK